MRFERWYLAALSGSQIQAPGSAGGTVTYLESLGIVYKRIVRN